MKVYLVVTEHDGETNDVDVFETRKDAEFHMNNTAKGLIESDKDLFEVLRSRGFVSIGNKTRNGRTRCEWYISILERVVGHYSEEDLKEFGS